MKLPSNCKDEIFSFFSRPDILNVWNITWLVSTVTPSLLTGWGSNQDACVVGNTSTIDLLSTQCFAVMAQLCFLLSTSFLRIQPNVRFVLTSSDFLLTVGDPIRGCLSFYGISRVDPNNPTPILATKTPHIGFPNAS